MFVARSMLVVAVSLVFLLDAPWMQPAEASAPATLQTTLPMADLVPGEPVIAVEADINKTPTGTASVRFDLTSLPAGAELASCAVRVVIANKVADDEGGGVLLSLEAEPQQTLAAKNVPPGTAAKTSVILRSKRLCDYLASALRPDKPVAPQFRLSTTTRERKVEIFGKVEDDRSLAPRLMLTYTLAGALPGDADWSQIRRDAQHSGRSAWRMYDPAGAYSPTGFAISPVGTTQIGEDDGPASFAFRQSPLLYDGRLFTVIDGGVNQYRIRALDRAGRVLAESPPITQKPRFLAASPRGRLFYAAENRILAYDIAGAALAPAPEKDTIPETLLDVPTAGANGALYVVTSEYVRAYSPQPAPQELWRYRTGQNNVAAVTLSADEATAYVLFGADAPRVVALDTATGDCRWTQALDGRIIRGSNEAMPIPVVAGRSVFITEHFPTGDKMFVVRDGKPPASAPGTSELTPPPPSASSCRVDRAPEGQTTIAGDSTHMPTPMAGSGAEAFFLKSGQLCWQREEQGGCAIPVGCKTDELTKVTLLIGDSSGGSSVTRLYGLDPVNSRLLALAVGWNEGGGLSATCRRADLPGLGPNLILAPDGTLFNYGPKRMIQAIVPNGFAPTAKDLTLTADLLATNNDTTFRVPGTIRTAPGLSVAAETDVWLVAGQRIGFEAGFTVRTGARLRARTGF